jgi:alkanesulfonate monooxygenase
MIGQHEADGRRAERNVAVGHGLDEASRARLSNPIGAGLKVFATTPPSNGAHPDTYLQRVADVARWSEAAGCEGTLLYTDNRLVDPWLVSQAILESTDRLCPLVAIQPLYMHPYAAAKMVSSLGFMYDRRVWINMLAGGFKQDLIALGDETPHDERYVRAVEYTRVMLELLAGGSVTFEGLYYNVKTLRMSPPLPERLKPGVLMSGSSQAGLAAARAIGAVPVKYPKPPDQEQPGDGVEEFGIRVGIIVRATAEEAWRVAYERFPEDRLGQIAHGLTMKVSDSRWHRDLSDRGRSLTEDVVPPEERDPYWLGPFTNHKTFCPYLVGTYDRIAQLLAAYVRMGAKTFVLDIPASEDELRHARVAFRGAVEASR